MQPGRRLGRPVPESNWRWKSRDDFFNIFCGYGNELEIMLKAHGYERSGDSAIILAKVN